MKITKNEEMLEAWDWELACSTGKRISRSDAHQKGIPHEAIHLWILTEKESGVHLLFQHRARDKDNYPDCLDISVGGHVPYGFTGDKVAKEAEEELGMKFNTEDLFDLGWYRYEERGKELFQREFQHIYLLRDNRLLNQYRFIDREVSGLYSVPYSEFRELLKENRKIEVEGFNGEGMVDRIISREDFHPQLFDASMEKYMYHLTGAIDDFCKTGTVEPGKYFIL